MDDQQLLRDSFEHLAAKAGRLTADCAVKDAAISDLRRQVQALEKELDDLTAP